MCGTGRGYCTAHSRPSLSRLRRTSTSQDRPSAPAAALAAGCSCRGRGISHFKRAFVPVPAGWVPHTVLPGAGEYAAGRGLGWVLGLLTPCPLGSLPLRADALERMGGGGERTAKVDSGDGPPSGSRRGAGPGQTVLPSRPGESSGPPGASALPQLLPNG